MNAGVDHARPRSGKPGGDPVEQPRAVGGEDRHPGRAVLLALDGDAWSQNADPRFGSGNLASVGGKPFGRFGDPVAVGKSSGMGAGRARLPPEFGCKRGLAGDHLLGPAALHMPEPKPFLGEVEQGADEPPFPFGPDPRPDRPDVDHGQDQEQPKPLGAGDGRDEIVDRLGIGEVALERGPAEQQMVAHQPRDGLGLGRIEPEARAEPKRDFRAQLAVIAAATLGDIVEQHRSVERPARSELAEQRGRQRVVLGQLTAFDLGKQADRPDGVLIDGVVMVHVELHLGDDPAEVGNEAAEHAGLVHPAKQQLGPLAVGEHVEE